MDNEMCFWNFDILLKMQEGEFKLSELFLRHRDAWKFINLLTKNLDFR